MATADTEPPIEPSATDASRDFLRGVVFHETRRRARDERPSDQSERPNRPPGAAWFPRLAPRSHAPRWSLIDAHEDVPGTVPVGE